MNLDFHYYKTFIKIHCHKRNINNYDHLKNFYSDIFIPYISEAQY